MKQTKKYVKNKKEEVIEDSYDVKSFFIILGVICAILVCIYIVGSIFEKKDYSYLFDNQPKNNEIQFEEVLVGTMLNQKEDTYYVLVLDKDEYYTTLSNYVSTYRGLNYEDKLYTVELENKLNQKSEKQDIDKLEFAKTTLLKVKNGKIKKSYEDENEIVEKLLSMIKEIEE